MSQFPQLLDSLSSHSETIAVIGLGYVGLPLAVEFAKKYRVIGFDINQHRIDELRQGRDVTMEVDPGEMALAKGLEFSADPEDLARAKVYIITVPTPIDTARRPDLGPLKSASTTVGRYLKSGSIVIYESTVYPGCTEEDCVPILEEMSGLACAIEVGDGNEGFRVQGSGFRFPENQNHGEAEGEPSTGTRNPEPGNRFFVGYSPERINPGDKEHRLPSILKVTSGSTPEAADFVDQLYASIITAGTFKAASIRVAEAAKVIENTQRDVNIALVNELAMLFNRLGLDTPAVLEAAGTKWNFLRFKPGLVGGHCIGVDPYYLTHKAQMIGFHPAMILSGRRTNDGMSNHIATEILKLMARSTNYEPGARVLVLGLTFKENCPDLRNTKVVDLVQALEAYNLQVDVHDPWVSSQEAMDEYNLQLIDNPEPETYAAVVLAVAHDEFQTLGPQKIRQWATAKGIIYDIKHVLPKEEVDGRL